MISRSKGGGTILMFAAQNGHASTVEVLVNAGADVNDVKDDGWTALMLAAQYGHEQTVSSLLDLGRRPLPTGHDRKYGIDGGSATRTHGNSPSVA